jgi:hypothetical protein
MSVLKLFGFVSGHAEEGDAAGNIPAELLEEHQTASSGQGTEVCWDGEQILDGLARRNLLVQSL